MRDESRCTGKYTLSVSYVGYKEYSQDIELVSGNIKTYWFDTCF